MAEEGFRDRLWQRFEGAVDPFQDTDREVLPASAWRFILYFARQATGPFVLLLIVGGAAGAVDAALYWSVGWLIDLLDNSNPQTLVADHWPELAALLALLLVVRTVVMIASAVVEQQIVVPGFYSMVRWQAFRRVIEQPYDFYQNDFAGRIATKIMQGGEAVGDFIVNILQTMWSFLTFVLLAITILVSLDPLMGLVVALWFAGYASIVYFLLPEMRSAGRATADERSIFNGRLVDAFTNIMAVKLFDSGRREHAYVRDGLERFLRAVMRLTRAVTTVRASVASLNGAMMSAIAAICIYKFTAGGISTGAIAAALGLVFRLNQMSGWMMFNINGLIRNYATVQDATRTISVRPAIRDAADSKVLPRAKGDIRFENVSFHYGKGGGIIENLNFHIRPGERVALVGPSGAGKTTLLKTISGVMDPEKGQILYRGQNIAGADPASVVRKGIVHVPEGREVFPLLTVAENLRMGAYTRTDAAGIAEDEEMVFAYFPILKERMSQAAGTLSGGQQQMLAIARGLMARPKVMLLDEPSLGLSPLLVKEIFQIVRRLNREQGVTMMLVEQNAKVALEVADYGYVMELGRIVMADTSERLLASKDVQEFYLGVQDHSPRGQKRWKQKKTWR
jgi:ATP-binding cassette subfamily B protein/ATP-binding cassette subfamily B multidrug efflux pump